MQRGENQQESYIKKETSIKKKKIFRESQKIICQIKETARQKNNVV